MFQIGLKEFFVIEKVRSPVPLTYVISDLNVVEIVTKKNCKRQIKTSLELSKQ